MSNAVLPQATPEQIEIIKQGAAARYQERGVTAEQADILFSSYISKLASAAGVQPEPIKVDMKKCAAVAGAIRGALKRTK